MSAEYPAEDTARSWSRCPVDVDLADPDTFSTGMPWASFVRMREEAPVFWHSQLGAPDGGFWAVTRHADVREVSRQPEIFCSGERGSLLPSRERISSGCQWP